MIYTVRFTRQAREDVIRLAAFMAERDPALAVRVTRLLLEAARSLETFPNRTMRLGDGRRELFVRFGASGYLLRYRVRGRTVTVAEIRHGRENR